MSRYLYKHEDMLKLLAEAGTCGNLAANLGMSEPAVKALVQNPERRPQPANEKTIGTFVVGKKQIKQIKRTYKRRGDD